MLESKHLVVLLALVLLCSGCVQNKESVAHSVQRSLYENNCNMSVTFIDVGQGDAEYLVFPNGQTMLIDAGTGRSHSNENLGRVVQHIDTFVITHDHSDHTGGFEYIENHYRVPDHLSYSHLKRGMFLHPDDTNVSVEVMNPWSMLPDEENDRSVVLLVTYNNVVFYFGGDVSSDIEDRLYPGNVDVLKVSHHGSKSSTSTVFLLNTKPRTAIIEVGDDNTYNHPSANTLTRLAGFGVDTYRTDESGNIRVCTDGDTYSTNVERDRTDAGDAERLGGGGMTLADAFIRLVGIALSMFLLALAAYFVRVVR